MPGACHLLNAAASAPLTRGAYRTASLNGREFWVVPFVSLVEGVLNGSKGPLFYPRDEIRKNPGAWNGTLLTIGHPTDRGGNPLSGKAPETVDSHGLGWVYNDWADETRRGGEAWFDKEWTRNKAPQVARKLAAGELVELSTGLGTEDYPAAPGAKDARGRHYRATARNYSPDHLAVLDGMRGACSLADGCGIGRNSLACNADDGTTSTPDPGLCPACGASLDGAGNCPACGWEPGKMVSPWEEAGERTAARPVPPTESYTTDNLLLRMWDRVVNAILPGQVRSSETGRIKRVGAGFGAGPVHKAAQAAFHAFTPSDRERELAAGITDPTLNPGWVVDEGLWAKARGIAEESGHAEDWPYVVGVYQRMGGAVAGDDEMTGNHGDHDQSSHNPHGGGGGGADGGAPAATIKDAWSKTPDDDPDFPDKVRGLVKGMSKVELKETAEALMAPMKRPDGSMSRGWSKIKPTAEGIVKAVDDRWGSVWRARNATTNDGSASCACGGTCGKCDNKADGTSSPDIQGDDSMNRNQMVAFLVANSAAWKDRAAVLNTKAGDKYVFEDATLKGMVDEVRGATANAAVVTALAEKLGDGAPALNEMPAFIKDKIEAKEDEEEEEDEDEKAKNKKGATKNCAKNTPAAEATVNFDNLTPAQLDALSKRLTGMTVNEAREAADRDRKHMEKEKRIVVNKLTAHLPDDARAARQKKLLALNLTELYDRLADMPVVAQNDDSGDRLPVYGGRIGAGDDVIANTENAETFDLTPMNWTKPKAGSAA